MSRVLQNKGNVITREYGNGHSGVDIVGTGNTIDNVIAHSSGKVIWIQTGYGNNVNLPAGTNATYGNAVKIQHANGYCTLYAHLKDVRVKLNQTVSQGQVIGTMSDSGVAYGIHLHFEVHKNGARINPKPYIDANLYGNIITNGGCTGIITYQACTKKWLEEVSKADNSNNGFAGDKFNFICGVRAKPQYGEIIIEAHQLNGQWLGAVSSKNYKTNDTMDGNSYAGIYGMPMDAFRIKSTEGYVEYRVLVKINGKLKWLNWVRGFGNKSNEYAGIFGYPIYGIQMK